MQSAKNFISESVFVLFVAVIFLGSAGCGSGDDSAQKTEKTVEQSQPLLVFVSILPQKTFVKQIAGERADVHVMVPPGQSPATYELNSRQLAMLEDADIYFTIGVPFEKSWMERIKNVNPKMQIIDTAKDIKLRSFKDHLFKDDDNNVQQVNDKTGMKDPHIWLDPNLVKIQARNICTALKNYDQHTSKFYDKNLTEFTKKLTELDQYIRKQLEGLKNRILLVYHPSWGYFTDSYDLQQVAIQHDGKDPGAKRLERLTVYMQEENITTIFVQKQFSQASAKAIANSVNADIVSLNPLPAEYFSTMKEVAGKIAQSAQKAPDK